MKAAILRLAQEAANEEEEEAAATGFGRRKLIPFDEDEFDDDFGNVSVVGDGETSDGEDDEVEEKVRTPTSTSLSILKPNLRSQWRLHLNAHILRTLHYSIVMRRPDALRVERY